MNDSSPSSRTSGPFRFAPYAVLAALGFTLVLAQTLAQPTGPRLSRREQLVDLIAREDARARALRDRLADLSAQVQRFEQNASGGQRQLEALRVQIDHLQGLAGLTEVTGPAVRVELRDSRLRSSPSGDPNDLVIHEQNLQAVVNALWAGGAEGIAINGERIISSSAVRCVGNTLLLHGSVYAPPYVVEAVGSTKDLVARLAADPQVQRFRVFAEEFRLGFASTVLPEVTLPAFRGIVAANVARRVAG